MALTLLIAVSGYFTLGIAMIVKYARSGDDVGLYLGASNCAIGILGIFFGTQMVHAVVRRLNSDGHSQTVAQ